MTDVRFTVFGRVGIELDGIDVRIPGRRERAVLAMLLAARGEVVPVSRLIDDVWGASPPDGAPGSLQVAISRLRTLLEPGRVPRASSELLVSTGAGYALVTGGFSVDAWDFVDAVDSAHRAIAEGRADRALELCEEAERIWTGPPFAEVVESERVDAERRRLEDHRACSLELRAESMLALGRHAMVTGELESLVTQYPFRERLWALHALALYRCARQAEALAVLQRVRALLREELGVDPSPELQQLEADVLNHEPGLGATQVVHRLPRAGPTMSERSDMVGREDALERLLHSLERARVTGTGRTVIVSGEAGIGKTRLITELADLAEASAAHVLWGRCHEADVSPAFWPWVPIVRELAGAHPSPEVSELLTVSAGTSSGDAGAAALRTYDAVSRLLATAARERPVVVLLEDIHWADTASLQLLAYAADTLSSVPVLLVATVRAVELPSEPLQVCLAALGRASAERILLQGLASEHVHHLVSRLHGSEVGQELAGVVADRTDGNPFFVIELVRLLAARGRLDPEGAREVEVPDGVQDVIRLRLARLPEKVRVLLGVAAVAGRGFDLHVVGEVAGKGPEETLDLLDVAVLSQAVEESDLAGRYRFTHALVRETLYASLSLARRGLLHAAIARALEPQLPDDADLAAEVAHHFVFGAAMRPELAGPAVQHSIAAAELAERRGALDQALVHWEQALKADAAGPQDPRRRYDVLLGLGRARHRRADIAGSRLSLGAAMDLARDLGDRELLATAATSFRGAGVWHWREFGTSDPAMVSVLEECASELPPGSLRIRAVSSLAMELTYEWRSPEAEAMGELAVQSARELADDALFADVVAMRTLAIWGKPGAADLRLELAREALASDLSQEDELYLRFGAASAHLQAGRASEADVQMTRCVELTRRLRHTGADIPIAWWRFYRAVDHADATAARKLLIEAMERHRLSSVVAVSDMEPMAQLRLAEIGAEVPEHVVALARGHANPAYRAVVGHALAEAGRPTEGAELLGAPVPDGAWDYASMYGDCLRVDVLSAAGRTEPLRAALARIRPWGEEFAVFGSTDCIGSIDYFIGRGLEGLGDIDGARAAYARAAAANRENTMVQWERRAELRLAQLAVRPPDTRLTVPSP